MKYFFHVGIHKTASTLFQTLLFPRLEGIRYFNARKTHVDFVDNILYADDFDFDIPNARQLFYQGANESQCQQVALLSDEQLYSSPWDGAVRRKRNVDRIASLFPSAHIIVVLRNQVDLLQSLYLQYIRTGGAAHWSDFLEAKAHPLIMSTGYFKYAKYINYLYDLFGKEHVHVLLYEDMKKDPIQYVNKWCSILGVRENAWDQGILEKRVNPAISPTWVPLMRFFNVFIKSAREPYHLLPRVFQRASEKLVRFLSKYSKSRKKTIPENAAREFLRPCHESNLELEELLGRDLKSLGYPTGIEK